MDTLDPNFDPNSPNKRLKSETLTLDSSIQPSIDKGKAPIIADDNESDDTSEDGSDSPAKLTPESCGICLSEEGKTVRGLIDSCDHYYCFLCIIEWSKIESRCPLCRGRFSSIRRVRKDGSFIGQGCVRVPVRDQIYDPFGQPVDPYSQAKCSVCNGTNDECLLLLCDLCDSASHTFCVGLGATVPEGDWYCRDCTLLRTEQHDGEMVDSVVTSTVSPRVDEPPSTSASISIFDIVRDPGESIEPNSGTNRLLQLVSQQPTRFSSSALASDQSTIASSRNVPDGRGTLHSSIDVSESSARTLQNCRNVHRHINVLRENWDAFRSGSLSFSYAFSDSFDKGSKKNDLARTSAKKSCKLLSSSSTSSSQSKAVPSLGDDTHNKESYNVDRAWKLMSIAKTKQQTNRPKSFPKVSQNKSLSIKRDISVPKRAVSVRKDPICPKSGKQKPSDKVRERPFQNFGKQSFTGSSASFSGINHQKSCQTASNASTYNNRVYLASSKNYKGASSTVLDHDSACSASSFGSIAAASDVTCSESQRDILVRPMKQVGYQTISTSSMGNLQTSVQTGVCHNIIGLSSSTNLGRGLSNFSDKQNSFGCSTSSFEPVSGDNDASRVSSAGKNMSACPGEILASITSKSSKDDEAKGEIQSLVKLNLKLLSRHKRLGVENFKEIARISTHTILASCGFEHRKIVRSLPTLVCHHGDQTQPLHRSTIVPNSCRDCFYAFVKDVVNTIMSEKLNKAGFAS